jgi:hypothetical protein
VLDELDWELERRGHRFVRSRCPHPPPSQGDHHPLLASARFWGHPGLHRQQALALHFLARELAGEADCFLQ